MAGQGPALAGFDLLSDELVVLILRKAVADPWPCRHKGGLKRGSVWGLATEAFMLRPVCKRFQRLAVPDAIPCAVWSFKGPADPIALVRCLQAAREAGSRLHGLDLDFWPLEAQLDMPVPIISLPFLDSLLCNSGVTRLSTFHLSTRRYKCLNLQDRAHSEQASNHLLTLLAAQPRLHRLEIGHSEFHFRSSLLPLHTFQELRELVIRGSVVSDAFIESLAKGCPQLLELSIDTWQGLSSPVFNMPSLSKLKVSTYSNEVLLELITIVALKVGAKVELSNVGALQLGQGVSKLGTLELRGEPASFQASHKVISVDTLLLFGDWSLAGLQSVMQIAMASKELRIVRQPGELRDAGEATYSSFFMTIPPGLCDLSLSGVLEDLVWELECESRLSLLRFSQLRSLSLDLASGTYPMFTRLGHLFACCPVLEDACFSLEKLACPGGDLLVKVTKLQARFPRVRLDFHQEPIFLTTTYIKDLLYEDGLVALFNQVVASESEWYPE